jgi:radical SAM superfamily enzyme with C-terminal helix-hairpin-helix motif
LKATLIDGYIDEPAALGVPPYISPYIRYTYGALVKMGAVVRYLTIDELRKTDTWKFNSDYLIIYGGTTVPGHYLSGTPITLSEVSKLLRENSHAVRVVSGPITLAYTIKGGSVAILPKFEAEHVVRGDVWTFFPEMRDHGARDDYDLVNELSVLGAELIQSHPFFPNVICEIEVSRGCERSSFCSFCTEPILHGRMKSRSVEGIVREVEALYKFGCRAFRLGRSANIIAYMSDRNSGKPSPEAVEELYSGIRSVAPDLEVLHTDNANPSYIVKNLKDSSKVIEIIVKYDTPMDILSFGAESFDLRVLEKNNIGSSPEEVKRAIEIVNEIGGFRIDGVPKLLPGINLLYGLQGESEETYRLNYEFLRRILDEGLLLRRINIRQVMVYPGTPLWRMGWRVRVRKKLFKYWKERIRREIDIPMMEKVFPIGAIIKGVIPERKEGKITFGRPLGTYPVLIGAYSEFQKKSDFLVVDHGPRSLTAIRYPFDINTATYEELSSIKGIGKKRASEIIMKRPFKNLEDMQKRLSKETFEVIQKLVKYQSQ